MKFSYLSKRLWDRHLGKISHYDFIAHKKCEMSDLTKRYFMVVKIDRENTVLDCMNTWEVRQTCCGQRVALLPCELGWEPHISVTRLMSKILELLQYVRSN